MVQGDTDAFVASSLFQDGDVFSPFHSDFRDMESLETVGEGWLLLEEKAPGPIKGDSRNAIEAESIVIDRGGRVAKRLQNVFWLKKRVLREKRTAVGIGRK